MSDLITQIKDTLAEGNAAKVLGELLPKLIREAEDGKIAELPCKVGDSVYWTWCDSVGKPDEEIQEEKVLYFYVMDGGIGIGTDWYDGRLGCFVEDGALIDGVRRIYLTREAAEIAIKERD